MAKEKLENTVKDNIKSMTRDEFIEYLEKKMYNYNKNGETLPSPGSSYSGSVASLYDFDQREF